MTEWKTKKSVVYFDIDEYVEWRTFMLDTEIRYKPQQKKQIMEHNDFHQTSNIKTGFEYISAKSRFWE
jgi:hypothetical protein